MKYYKLVRQNLQMHNGFQWEIGKWKCADGSGVQSLCSDGWLHCYEHPLVAVFMNPIHVCIQQPRLFEVEIGGFAQFDGPLKCGFRHMRLVKELKVPTITTEQRNIVAIHLALMINPSVEFRRWAENWLDGGDRSAEAAQSAWLAMQSAAHSAWPAAWSAKAAQLAAAQSVELAATRSAQLAQSAAAQSVELAATRSAQLAWPVKFNLAGLLTTVVGG